MIILKLDYFITSCYLRGDYFEARPFLDIFFFQVLSLEEILAEGVPAQVTADHSDEDCQNDHHWNITLIIKMIIGLSL